MCLFIERAVSPSATRGQPRLYLWQGQCIDLNQARRSDHQMDASASSFDRGAARMIAACSTSPSRFGGEHFSDGAAVSDGLRQRPSPSQAVRLGVTTSTTPSPPQPRAMFPLGFASRVNFAPVQGLLVVEEEAPTWWRRSTTDRAQRAAMFGDLPMRRARLLLGPLTVRPNRSPLQSACRPDPMTHRLRRRLASGIYPQYCAFRSERLD